MTLRSNVPPFDIVGREVVMTLNDSFGELRTIAGIIAECEREIIDAGNAHLRIVMRPRVFPMSLSRDSRVFNDMTVPQIVDRVMEKTQAPHRWELTGAYRERVYTAQYRESDWTFISRLLEDEGIYYWFDHTPEQSVVVFSDDSTAAPRIVGSPEIGFVFETGMLGDSELITEIAAEAHATATKFTVGSFDPWNPALKVLETKGDGMHEMYDAPAGAPEDPAVIARRAQIRLEGSKSHRASVSGNTSSIRMVPGRRMVVVDHPLHDGDYFITETRYRSSQRRRFGGEAKGGYECHFECINSAVIFRPPEDTPNAEQAGIQTGRVVGPPGEEIHTDFKGRVRVQLHWDREGAWDDKAGKWMRCAQRGVASSMLYPRIGWNVTTFMEEGNVDAPTVLSRVHDAEHPPTYKLPENKTRTVFRTLTSPGGGSANEIRFEDLAGMQEMFINASKDWNQTIGDRNGLNVGRNHEHVVMGEQNIDVATAMSEDVQNDQTTNITGNEEIEIEEARDKTVRNDESEEITGNPQARDRLEHGAGGRQRPQSSRSPRTSKRRPKVRRPSTPRTST